MNWFMNILNAVVELEVVPGGGGEKDPLQTDSYRGITQTLMVANVLEFLVLERLQMVLSLPDT